MKVTLRKFLDIVGNDFLQTYLTDLYVEEWDELFEDWYSKRLMRDMKSIEELEPYLEYEITAFHQILNYGEIEVQEIYVRKIEEQRR